MCGLAGIFDFQAKREIDGLWLQRTNVIQAHRGPDDEGTYQIPGLGLAHRRLAIIDLSSDGHQPMHSPDGQAVIVYNGEVYNFRELKDELRELGVAFRTHSDTEVVLAAWQAWGKACTEKLRGMFSLAIWDAHRGGLFLARDRLGIKPLYYTVLDDGFVLFASELKALLSYPKLRRELNPQAVEQYFALGYVPDPHCILKNVYKLSAGYSLFIERGKPVPEPSAYWDIPYRPETEQDEKKLTARLRELLDEAVKIRTVADVPLGGFLSGGVDSSAVVATLAQQTDQAVKTCTIGFDEDRFNESEYANKVADLYKTDHTQTTVRANDTDLIQHLAGIYDEPFADSSALPTYRLCESARKQVTVALSGDGSDELLTGYRRQRLHLNEERVRDCLPLGLRKPLFGALGALYPKADWAPQFLRAKSTLQALSRDPVEAYYNTVAITSAELRSKLFSHPFKQELQDYDALNVYRDCAKKCPHDEPMFLMQYLDAKIYLPGDILTKVDRASMAHSLEVRVPFLDHHFTEWAFGLDPKYKLRNGCGKYLLKKSFESDLPEDILYRQKMGFSIPIQKWFKEALYPQLREQILGEKLSDTQIFDKSILETMLHQHKSGVRDNSVPLWALWMFSESIDRLI